MHLNVSGLDVVFPYTYIYPEQRAFMKELKKTLDTREGHALLEMPSGTGKTIAILALFRSYCEQFPHIGKLIYCSRTVGEVEKALEEMKHLENYRDKDGRINQGGSSSTQSHGKRPFLAIGLSSRRNLCVHPVVSQSKYAAETDAKCFQMTAPWARDKAEDTDVDSLCSYFEDWAVSGKEVVMPSGVYTLEGLRKFGKQQGWCPYALARRVIQQANIIICSYQYLIDPKVANQVTTEMSGNAVVVFDEGHNIDNVCLGSLTVTLTMPILDKATKNIAKLERHVSERRKNDETRLQAEFSRLVDGLEGDGNGEGDVAGIVAELRASPVVSSDILIEEMPGNIKQDYAFISAIKRFVEHIKKRLRDLKQVVLQSTDDFLRDVKHGAVLDAKPMVFFYDRLIAMLSKFQIDDMLDFSSLHTVADFATLMGTYETGFTMIFEPFNSHTPGIPNPTVQLCCLDASIAMSAVSQKFRHVVITSGTLSPLSIYPRLLGFAPVVSVSLPMTLSRTCISPLVVTRGDDQVSVSTRYDVRQDPSVVRNYGQLLLEMSKNVPDGIVAFFPSYFYMESIVLLWHEMGMIQQIMANKLLFLETRRLDETSLALDNYRKACNVGRGAILLSVARGKVSEGIDFDNHFGRCVIMFGIPFVSTESHAVKARMEYLKTHYQIRDTEYLAFDAMRVTAQCMGRVIRSKDDYGIMVFADSRYNRADKKNKLPVWITQFLDDSHVNLSTDMAVNIAKRFLREMAQPRNRGVELGKALLSEEQARRLVVAENAAAAIAVRRKDEDRDGHET